WKKCCPLVVCSDQRPQNRIAVTRCTRAGGICRIYKHRMSDSFSCQTYRLIERCQILMQVFPHCPEFIRDRNRLTLCKFNVIVGDDQGVRTEIRNISKGVANEHAPGKSAWTIFHCNCTTHTRSPFP